MARDWRLGIDYGTSNTVAVLQWPDGRTRPLLFDGSPLLPSAVYLDNDGRLVLGRDAERSARLDPARYEPNPKRRIDDGEVWLGDRGVPLVEIVAATLRLVAGEAARIAGQVPRSVQITYPAAWGAVRRGTLLAAASQAALPTPTLVPEPVAAAAYFASVLGHRVANGHHVVVYDLGAGTFDVSAVRRQPDGFTVSAVDGMDNFGGLDLDAVVVDQVGTKVPPEVWQRLTSPASSADRRHARMLWDDARGVKESLSRQQTATLHVPLAEVDVALGRAELEAGARNPLERAARLTHGVIRDARINEPDLAGLFLVGGSTRVPLVGSTVQHGVGIPPTVFEQPEIVVAEGALHAVRMATEPHTAGGALATAPMTPPTSPPGGPTSPLGAPTSPAPVALFAAPAPT
ncbi:MAG: Hsp70 family protein, partial [Micromonosporaceae bacterium]